jgi:hypothetical protein
MSRTLNRGEISVGSRGPCIPSNENMFSRLLLPIILFLSTLECNPLDDQPNNLQACIFVELLSIDLFAA